MSLRPPQIDSVKYPDGTDLPDVILAVAQYFQGIVGADDGVSRKYRLFHARTLKGGWECWLQVELAIALDDECGVFFSREEAVYNVSGQLIDLWGEPRWHQGI
jgi:hypothetical protein